jgi:hypothetical protein
MLAVACIAVLCNSYFEQHTSFREYSMRIWSFCFGASSSIRVSENTVCAYGHLFFELSASWECRQVSRLTTDASKDAEQAHTSLTIPSASLRHHQPPSPESLTQARSLESENISSHAVSGFLEISLSWLRYNTLQF